jgi:D-alanine-D-alanine ligase
MINIGILYGGYSSEFEISKKSATTIFNNFPKALKPYLIEVTRDNWHAIIGEKKIELNIWELTFFTDQKNELDAFLIYTHGKPGENGQLQAYLEMREKPVINSGFLASALSFDKWYCNQFLRNFNIPVADSIVLNKTTEINIKQIIQKLSLPCFVKPTDSGSSFGISKVKKESDLIQSIENAFKEGNRVVIESNLAGVEVTCGIYNTKNGLKTLPITEIVSENDFFDYDAKYNGKSNEIIPARISETIEHKIYELSKEIYELLNLKSVARIDFMIVDNKPTVIEVNTTPGFSSASIVPQMLNYANIKIEDFWNEIITFELADLI